MKLRPIHSLDDAMVMRKIRNQCRFYMTRNTRRIGWLQQLIWWLFKKPEEMHCYLVTTEGEGACGYAILKVEGNRAWLTAGLVPESRGQGLGTETFAELKRKAISRGLEPWLEVRNDNEAAKHVYAKLGFEPMHEVDGITTMRQR